MVSYPEPYAEKFGVWQRGMGPFKTALEEIWQPYLKGQGTRDEALTELIKRTAVEPPKRTTVSNEAIGAPCTGVSCGGVFGYRGCAAFRAVSLWLTEKRLPS